MPSNALYSSNYYDVKKSNNSNWRFLNLYLKGLLTDFTGTVRGTDSGLGIRVALRFFSLFDPFVHYGRFNGVKDRSKISHQ